MNRALRSFKVLMGFSFEATPWRATLFLLSGAVMSLTYPVGTYGTKLLIDGVAAGDTRRVTIAAVLMALAVSVAVINGMYYIDLLFAVAEKASAQVDRRLMALMAGTPRVEHHEVPAYLDRLQLLQADRARLGWMTNATAGLVRVLVLLVSSGVLLARLHPALLLLPLFGLLSFWAGRRAQMYQRAGEETSAEPERLRRHLFETATAASTGKEVRIFGLADELVARHHAAANEVLQQRDRADWRSAWLRCVDAFAITAGYVCATGFVLVLALRGQATAGDVVMAIGLAAAMNAVVVTAVGYGTAFLHILRVAERFLWLQDYADDARDALDASEPVPDRVTHGIELRDVSFRYPGATHAVLDRLSLTLPAGLVVALVGENGAGKTTLAKLLCGFYAPTAGRVLLDGRDVARFDLTAWRARIAAAFQDFVRFEFLLRETVGVGDLARMDDTAAVQSALLRAGAETVPALLPQGLDTPLGRSWDGAELSGGQWQKLALGRAMMRPTPFLLLLDEPTASLDAQAEYDLFERYAGAMRRSAAANTITLLVSHRFSTVRMADLIVVLEGGRVREVGSHAQLMARGDLYAELYELQARTYQ